MFKQHSQSLTHAAFIVVEKFQLNLVTSESQILPVMVVLNFSLSAGRGRRIISNPSWLHSDYDVNL